MSLRNKQKVKTLDEIYASPCLLLFQNVCRVEVIVPGSECALDSDNANFSEELREFIIRERDVFREAFLKETENCDV